MGAEEGEEGSRVGDVFENFGGDHPVEGGAEIGGFGEEVVADVGAELVAAGGGGGGGVEADGAPAEDGTCHVDGETEAATDIQDAGGVTGAEEKAGLVIDGGVLLEGELQQEVGGGVGRVFVLGAVGVEAGAATGAAEGDRGRG